MNILVTGADGQLGNEIRIVARDSRDHYVFTDVAQLDITDADAVDRMVREEQIGLIVNCAAYTNVDAAEENQGLAALLNAQAVGILAQAMRRVNGVLIHVSTDYVFGGASLNVPIGERQAPCPTGVYGRTKLEGEQAVVASGCRYLIFRTAWLYSEFGKNFVKTMMRLTSERNSVSVVFDQVGTPTYALDLAQAICGIIENRQFDGHEGIFHYTNEGVCSWYDFAVEITRMSGHTACEVLPCHSSEFPSAVVRPSYSVLDKSKFKREFGLRIPHWTDSLRRCIGNM